MEHDKVRIVLERAIKYYLDESESCFEPDGYPDAPAVIQDFALFWSLPDTKKVLDQITEEVS